MPHISVSLGGSDEILNYEIAADLTIVDLKRFINAETGVPVEALVLNLNGQTLDNDTQTLQAAGISEHDMLTATIRLPQAQRQRPSSSAQQLSQQAQQPSQEQRNAEIEVLRQRLASGSAYQLEDLARQSQELANVVNDPARFRDAFEIFDRLQHERAAQRMARLEGDELDAENQAEIEEFIRQENVEREMQIALAENPEFFAPVTMLYIDLEVNGHPVKAFVDSGAQATIMSPSCAEACNVTRLLDTHFAGIAVGVGTSRILGKVHRATVRIGDAELPCAFTVMEGKEIDMLLGLDMLKRYQASIDLHQNRLVLHGGVSVPFLPESDIPKRFLQALNNEPVISGPGGTTIGAKSGAIKPARGSIAGTSGDNAATSPTNSHRLAKPTHDSTSPASNTTFPATAASGSAPGLIAAPNTPSSTVPSPVPRPSAPTPAQATLEFPQESIDTLLRLGATRAQAIDALRATRGNVDYAAGIIYDQD